MDYNNRRYLVIPISIIDEIDFNEVIERSKKTLLFSIDGTKTIVKYDVFVIDEDIENVYIDATTGEEKTQITKSGVYGRPSFYSEEYDEYNHDEILILLNGEEWSTNE